MSAVLPYMPAIMSVMGAMTKASGTVAAGGAGVAAAINDQTALQFRAKQEMQQAQQARAAASVNAEDQGIQLQYALSHLAAQTAAGGAGGLTSPGITALAARMTGEMALRMARTRYEGDVQAKTLTDQANADIFTGDQKVAAAKSAAGSYKNAALSGLLSSGASLYEKYGQGLSGGMDTHDELNSGFVGGYNSDNYG